MPLMMLLTHLPAAHLVHEALARAGTDGGGIGARICGRMVFPRREGCRNRCRFTDCRLEWVREPIAATSFS